MTLTLPESLRIKLKKPLGGFIKDLESLKGRTLVCVGDQASKDVLGAGFKPLLCVYDGMIRRVKVSLPKEIRDFDAKELKVANPAGTISGEAVAAVEKALSSGVSHKVLVDGEEDLVALVAIKFAPNGSMVLYGQPGEGLVGVEVNSNVKKKVESMLKEMEDGR